MSLLHGFLLALACIVTVSGREGSNGKDASCTPGTSLVVFEDFESDGHSAAVSDPALWKQGELHIGHTFTDFMVRSDSVQSKHPQVTYPIPIDADYLMVSFDFYEIGDWKGKDAFSVSFNSEKVDLQKFNSQIDEKYKKGWTRYGITWTADSSPSNLQFSSEDENDQIHHMTAKIPSALFAPLGELTMTFMTNTRHDSTAMAGIDNIKIEAVHECGVCESSRIIAHEDFETHKAKGWVQGAIVGDSSFSNYLGRANMDDAKSTNDPLKIFIVPDDAESISLEFDFYEIDQWDGNDRFFAYINDIEIPFGVFHEFANESPMNGKGKRGITWTIFSNGEPAQIGGSENHLDQIHHVKVAVPRRVYRTSGGLLQVRFASRADDLKWNGAAGFDNIKIEANFACPREAVAPTGGKLAESSRLDGKPSFAAENKADIVQNARQLASPSVCNEYTANFYISPQVPKGNCTWLASEPTWVAQVCNPRSTAWFYCPNVCGRHVNIST